LYYFSAQKKLRAEELNDDPFSYRKPYNTTYSDSDTEKGGGATVVPIHSGSGIMTEWPAEQMRRFIEEKGNTPEEQIALLKNSITNVVVIQAEGLTHQNNINYADPRQIAALVTSVDINGKNMRNPVFQEAEIIDIARLNPQQTTQLAQDYAQKGAQGQRVALKDHIPGSPDITIGDMAVIFCGEAVPGESQEKTRPPNQQARNFIMLRPK